MGRSFSVNEIVKKIIYHSGKDIRVRHDLEKPSINTKLAFNSEKAKRVLGWEPKISLDTGIKMTISWYNNNVSGD